MSQELGSLHKIDLNQIGGMEILRGNEEGIMKRGMIDAKGLGFDFTYGFMHYSENKENIKLRHQNWLDLRQAGFGEFLTRNSGLVSVMIGEGKKMLGVLTEDLTTGGTVLFEHKDFTDGSGSKLVNEASGWLVNFFEREVNVGTAKQIQESISRIGSDDIRKAVRGMYDFYIGDKESDELPVMDPFLENDFSRLKASLEEKGWGVGVDSLFVGVSKTGRYEWPYGRRLLLGDLGESVSRYRKPGFDRWTLEEVYAMFSHIYRHSQR